jgi:hypothetical protein
MSFILLSHWNGRFGNRMHQYAYGATYSKINNVDFILPSDWEGTKLFKNQYHKLCRKEDVCLGLNQSQDYFHKPENKKKFLQQHYPRIKQINPEEYIANYQKYDNPVYFDSVCAYGNSVYSKMSKDDIIKIFEFSDEVKSTDAYKFWSKKAGTYDIAHLRRDDIANAEYNNVNTQGYSVISKDSYEKAFIQFGFNKDEILWVSDDNTGKWHTRDKKLKNFGWNYPTGSVYKEGPMFDWLEDFLKLYFARNIFRANSSFSWWASFLSPTATVYSPVLDKISIYGRNNKFEEIDVDFVRGNHPHWMYNVAEEKYIIINER